MSSLGIVWYFEPSRYRKLISVRLRFEIVRIKTNSFFSLLSFTKELAKTVRFEKKKRLHLGTGSRNNHTAPSTSVTVRQVSACTFFDLEGMEVHAQQRTVVNDIKLVSVL